MDYQPNFVEEYSIEDCKSEIKHHYDMMYSYGYAIPYCRIWDLEFTIDKLSGNKEWKCHYISR